MGRELSDGSGETLHMEGKMQTQLTGLSVSAAEPWARSESGPRSANLEQCAETGNPSRKARSQLACRGT